MRALLKKIPIDWLLIVIITTPAIVSLLNGAYFSMHDDQHIVRLFLLDTGIKQGYLFPRWVDGLGFGFGYPLFNFYPPLIYYVGEFFHLIGFSLIWSVKLIVIAGFYLASFGMFFFAKKLIGRLPALVAAALYTYFLYHGVAVYVRGALAEFFTMSILPFLFLALWNIYKKPSVLSAIMYGFLFALLILTHPLIAFPSIIFIGAFFFFGAFFSKNRKDYLITFIAGSAIGLGLSSFFWLPSLAEKQFTLTDAILTRELADYAIHFVCPQQLWFSPWGYGGSAEGCTDGISFQLGKVQIAMVLTALVLFTAFLFKRKKDSPSVTEFIFFVTLLGISIVMMIPISKPVWDSIQFLSYLQFPWRFLTFTAVFISIVGAYAVFFLGEIVSIRKKMNYKLLMILFSFLIIVTVIQRYAGLFKPQSYLQVTDKEQTTQEEVQWRISRSSFEFIPKGVETQKSELNTTIPVIEYDEAFHDPMEVIGGEAVVRQRKNKFGKKIFTVVSEGASIVRLNVFSFPGWKAYVDGKAATFNEDNAYKLITLSLPKGSHEVVFIFEDTPVRKVGNMLSLLTLAVTIFLTLKFIKIKR